MSNQIKKELMETVFTKLSWNNLIKETDWIALDKSKEEIINSINNEFFYNDNDSKNINRILVTIEKIQDIVANKIGKEKVFTHCHCGREFENFMKEKGKVLIEIFGCPFCDS